MVITLFRITRVMLFTVYTELTPRATRIPGCLENVPPLQLLFLVSKSEATLRIGRRQSYYCYILRVEPARQFAFLGPALASSGHSTTRNAIMNNRQFSLHNPST